MSKERLFEEQEAPLKNTDHAYVQVSEDGSPRMPERGESGDQYNRDDQNSSNHGKEQNGKEKQ